MMAIFFEVFGNKQTKNKPNHFPQKPIAGLKFGIRSGSRTTALDAEMMETNLLFLLGLGERKPKHVDVLQRGSAREKIIRSWLFRFILIGVFLHL